MNKGRNLKQRPQGDIGGGMGARIEYDRADEKRKVQEEIEDFLTERQEKRPPQQDVPEQDAPQQE